MSDFIYYLRRKMDHANKVKMYVTPYQAILILLRQLEPELEAWVNSIQVQLQNKDPDSITQSKFLQICNQAKDQAMVPPNQTYSAILTENSAKNASEKNQGSRQAMNRRNSPPNGMKADDWARTLRDSTNQRNSKGGCYHCGQPSPRIVTLIITSIVPT